MTPKERMQIERVKMNELDPEYRSHCIEEVNQGLTQEQALIEAKRCLKCKNPQCVEGCPVGIAIPEFIAYVENNEIDEAAKVIRRTSSLPAVCGRVCPQERQCESKCVRLKMGDQAVAIGYLERFVADHSDVKVAGKVEKNGMRVAVVGSGPCGLSFAGDMAKRGFSVTVYEALHEIGGVLKYGIPEFRLPNKIVDNEINTLRELGVEFCTDTIIGKTITVDELRTMGYRAIFVASGAGLPNFMNIPGENLIGVMSSNEYLTRVNLMGAARDDMDTPVLRGKRVAVIGGGNTAMDSARTARRLGAERVMIVYRRSEEEMPARLEEVKHAKEEGIEFHTLHNPIEYYGDEKGRVVGMLLQVMELGEADASGRRKPIAVEGKTEEVDVDMVIVSVGVSPNPIIPSTVSGLEVTKKGTIVVAEDTRESSVAGLYAGGDIVRGGATVILAMGDGRKAASAVADSLLMGR